MMADKYDVKQYVASIIGKQYVVENYGVWNKIEDIDFNSLPSQFVIKATHDSSGAMIAIHYIFKRLLSFYFRILICNK